MLEAFTSAELRDLNRALLVWSADPNSSDLATLVPSRNLTLNLISNIRSVLVFLRQKENKFRSSHGKPQEV